MKNEYRVEGNVVTMEVQGKHVKIDSSDLPIVSGYRWKAPGKNHVCSGYRNEYGNGTTITLHKLLLGSKHAQWLNGDIYDCRRSNMVPSEKVVLHRERGRYLKGNEYRIEGDTLVIIMKYKGAEYEAYADYEDYPIISRYTWSRNPVSGYARSIDRITREDIYMHRLVMGAKVGDSEIDHINGLPADNRKSNLRFCTSSQNKHNNMRHRLGVAGVSRHESGGWAVRLQINGNIKRKYFNTFDEAVEQYREWEREFNPSGLS